MVVIVSPKKHKNGLTKRTAHGQKAWTGDTTATQSFVDSADVRAPVQQVAIWFALITADLAHDVLHLHFRRLLPLEKWLIGGQDAATHIKERLRELIEIPTNTSPIIIKIDELILSGPHNSQDDMKLENLPFQSGNSIKHASTDFDAIVNLVFPSLFTSWFVDWFPIWATYAWKRKMFWYLAVLAYYITSNTFLSNQRG